MFNVSEQQNPWYAAGDPWVRTHEGWEPEKSIYFETIFSQSNGYMGIRGYREENDNAASSVREGYLAGVFAALPPPARKLLVHDYPWDSLQMVSLPQIFSARITLDGEVFSLAEGEVSSYVQTLDMHTGIMRRQMTWTSPEGKATNLCFTRFLSASTPNLAVQKISIEPVDWTGDAEIMWNYDLAEETIFRCGDPVQGNLSCPLMTVVDAMAEDACVRGAGETAGTHHTVVFRSRIAGEDVRSMATAAGILSQAVIDKVEQGKASSRVRTTTIETSRDDHPVSKITAGYDELVAEHKAVWAARWEDADIEIDGCVRDQILVRFSIFSLLQVAPFHTDRHSIPARCYAFNRYNGTYFWDGEIFLLPFYQFCAPEVARNMLRFRCRTLPGARKNAVLLGSKGAVFPWQGDADFGSEQAPWGLSEFLWHQNADIVYAFDQYARTTGDEEFMFNEGLEVLAETARFWISKLERDGKGIYHLNGTVGPDEAAEHGPDNGYTSLMVRRSLEISHRWCTLALEQSAAAPELDEDEVAAWKAVAAKIHVPEVPGQPGVPLQDAFLLTRKPVDLSRMTVADYWKHRSEVRVIKQADIVLAMYLLEDNFTADEIRRGYEFYEPMTLHVSSLSCNTHSIVAAIIGHCDEAYSYFQRAAGLDLDNLRNATEDGLHSASLGGVWQMAIPGFTGMRVRDDHISFQPALPEVWKRIRFPLQYRGWKLSVELNSKNYRIGVSGNGQSGAVMKIGKKEYTLADGLVAEDGSGLDQAGTENPVCSKSAQLSLT